MSTFSDKFFADKAVGALWDVAVSIKRGNHLPLDKDSVVHGIDELNAIAAGAVSYPGQIIAVIEDAVYEGEGQEQVLVSEETTTLYYLDHNKTPREVGKVPVGDDLSIDVVDEKIALHDFGKVFYKYIPEVKDDEGNVTSEARYDRVEVSASNPWKAGLEPKVVTEDGKLILGWYEPNPTTIDGVNDQVTAVQGTVEDLQESVGAPAEGETAATGLYKEIDDVEAEVNTVKEDVKEIDAILNGTEAGEGVEAVKGLVERVETVEAALPNKAETSYVNEELGKKANSADVYSKTEADNLLANKADKATTLAGYGIGDAYTKTEVETYVQGQIGSAGHLKRVILAADEELPAVESADLDTIYMKPLSGGLVAQDAYEEYMVINGAWEVIGNTRVDLSEYAKTTYVDDEIDKVEEELAKKAVASEVETALGLKADQSELNKTNEAVALKASQADLNTANQNIEKKADKTYVDEELGKKADSTQVAQDIASAIAPLAVKEEVQGALDLKADKTELTSLATKQELSDGLAQKIGSDALEPYAKTETVNAELAKKVDKTAYDEKMTQIDNGLNAKLDIETYNSEKGSFATDEELRSAIGAAPEMNEETGEYEGATGIYTNIYTKDEITKLIGDITGGESAADVLAALNAYKTSNDPRVKALEDAINGIPADEDAGTEAVPGLKERVEALENEEDYQLPVATASELGGVLSSDAENGVAVDAEGKMTVNKINANKLTQTTGEYLILYGGSASDNI